MPDTKEGASTTAAEQGQSLTVGNDLLPNNDFNQVRTPTTTSFKNTNTTFMFLNSIVTILGSVFFFLKKKNLPKVTTLTVLISLIQILRK